MQPTSRREALAAMGAVALATCLPAGAQPKTPTLQSWPLNAPKRTGIHDIAPAPHGGVWFSVQASGHLGYLSPASGKTELIALGMGSAPHGVIQGPDKAAWLTDGGQQAIVRVGWPDREVRKFALPEGSPYANLNTCAFDGEACRYRVPNRRVRRGNRCLRLSYRRSNRQSAHRRLCPSPLSACRDVSARKCDRAVDCCNRNKLCGCDSMNSTCALAQRYKQLASVNDCSCARSGTS